MLYQTENRHGGDIYGGIALDFSANVSPLGTPRSVTDADRTRAARALPLPRPLLPDTRTDDLGI